jgi:hypothetical protein
MDDELDRAIRAVLSISAPDEVRARVIDAAATWRRFPWVKACAVAAIVLILVGEVVYVRTIERNVVQSPPPRRVNTGEAPVVATTQTQPTPDRDTAPLRMAAMWTTSVHVEVAENAPVIVANGGKGPIRLGASIPQQNSGDALHVWDWTKSPASSVHADIEFGESQRVLVQPNGKLFVWTGNTVRDLDTGAKSLFDVGDMNIHVGPATYTRIGATRFSPAGKYLAAESWLTVLVTDVATGDVVSSLYSGRFAGTIQWSADGKTLTTVSTLGAGEGGDDGRPAGRYDIYPTVMEWDWRSGKLIRSIPAKR